jgi:tetratricopeptide (TPR) repeat protein
VIARRPRAFGGEGRRIDHGMAPDIRQLVRRGTAAFEAGEYSEAETLLLRVLDRNTTYANVYHMLGVIASLRGASQRAVDLFRRALALNPGYSEAQLNLAITLADMGAYDVAAEEVGKLQAREPGDADRPGPAILGKLANAHADLARKYHALGMYAEAVGEYDKALGLCPNFPDIHNRRAASCRELRDYAGAKASLTRALKLNPRYVEAYVNLGDLHRRMGHPAEAIAAWERALELDPAHPLARVYLAQAAASGVDGG